MAQPDKSPARRHIVILGGSFGGISTAHYLLKHAIPVLPGRHAYQVVLVSPASEAFCRPACPRALISDDLFDQKKLFVDIPEKFEQYPEGTFRFVQGAAAELSHVDRTVRVDLAKGGTETITYHALVIATGAQTPSPLFSRRSNTASLRSRWAAVRESLPTARSIVIAGGGPTGVETAGELGEHLNGSPPSWLASLFSAKPSSPSPRVAITVVTSAPKILPLLRPAIAHKAEAELARLGVAVRKNARVEKVVPNGSGTDDSLAGKTTVVLDDGGALEADLYIPATGMTPSTGFVDPSLLAADGRVQVQIAEGKKGAPATTFRVDKAGERVYAFGDVVAYHQPAIRSIVQAVPVLGANVKRDLLLAAGFSDSEVAADRLFEEDKRETQFVAIGRGRGVGAAMGYQLPSFLVWLIKGRDYWLWMMGGLWSGKMWVKES